LVDNSLRFCEYGLSKISFVFDRSQNDKVVKATCLHEDKKTIVFEKANVHITGKKGDVNLHDDVIRASWRRSFSGITKVTTAYLLMEREALRQKTEVVEETHRIEVYPHDPQRCFCNVSSHQLWLNCEFVVDNVFLPTAEAKMS
jgi:hypothetical protein